ncbi:hypothetical protein NC651_033432 [Populus alba x Populus x berolinensis]|nr:hypothetical protein NC651_033432 [Populus alba x Populus x berolinensis]
MRFLWLLLHLCCLMLLFSSSSQVTMKYHPPPPRINTDRGRDKDQARPAPQAPSGRQPGRP